MTLYVMVRSGSDNISSPAVDVTTLYETVRPSPKMGKHTLELSGC